MTELDICEVARQSGVPASTLRFYEQKGLINTIGRRGLRRVFARDVLQRLALIALGRAAGFSVEEIGFVLLRAGQVHNDRRYLVAKARELDRTIQQLSVVRDGLFHASACKAPSLWECPRFEGILHGSRAMGTRAKRAARPTR